MPEVERKSLKWDMSVNLGHILTILSFLFAIVGTWNIMSNRIVVLEESRESQRKDIERVAADISDLKKVVREDIQGINSKIDQLLYMEKRK